MRSLCVNEGTIELQGKQYERPMIRFAVIMRTACFPQISYRKILVKFSTYPDPLEWVLLLEDITTTESLNQSQAACRSIDRRIWLATVSHYVREHICNKRTEVQRYIRNASDWEGTGGMGKRSGHDLIRLNHLVYQRGFFVWFLLIFAPFGILEQNSFFCGLLSSHEMNRPLNQLPK